MFRFTVWIIVTGSCIVSLFWAVPGSCITRYVDAGNLTPAVPYTNWNTAAVIIQDAVDVAVDGDMVLVTDGVYDSGGRALSGFNLSNRVVITKDIDVVSVNGPAVTFILGSSDPETGGTGTNAVRGVYMNAGVLSGFTVTNGYTQNNVDEYFDIRGGGIWCTNECIITNCYIKGNTAYGSGGGVYCDGKTPLFTDCIIMGNSSPQNGAGMYLGTADNCIFIGNNGGYGGGAMGSMIINSLIISNNAIAYGGAGGTLSNCIIQGNSAVEFGGGTSHGTVDNCLITDNRAESGGGTSGGTVNNCLIMRNWASRGGGTSGGTINNCTIIGNTATNMGGGSYGSDLNNSIIYYNSAPVGTNTSDCFMRYSCSTEVTGHANLTGPPQFVDHNNGNYRLKSTSPCINRGDNDYITWGRDFDGNDRIIGCVVDLGAYEYVLTGAWIKIIPEAFAFGEVVIGEVKDTDIHVFNWGVVELNGYATNFAVPFSVTDGSPYQVDMCRKELVTMSFSPDEEGVFSNEVVLTGGGGANVLLTGTGVPEPVGVVMVVAGIFWLCLKRLFHGLKMCFPM